MLRFRAANAISTSCSDVLEPWRSFFRWISRGASPARLESMAAFRTSRRHGSALNPRTFSGRGNGKESGMLLRQWFTLVSGFFKPRLRFFDECSVALRVWPNDLDVNVHMTNSRYLLAMDLGRWDFGVRTRLWREMGRRRWFPLVGSATLRFRKGLDPFQRYELRTRLVAWDEKWCWFEQRFCVGEALHAVGRVKVLFRGPQGNVPTAELFAACGAAGAPARQVPENIRLWLEAEGAEQRLTSSSGTVPASGHARVARADPDRRPKRQ